MTLLTLRSLVFGGLPDFLAGQGDYLAEYATGQDDVGGDIPTDSDGEFLWFYDRQVMPVYSISAQGSTNDYYGFGFDTNYVDIRGIDGSGRASWRVRVRDNPSRQLWLLDQIFVRDIPYSDDQTHYEGIHIRGWYLHFSYRVDAGTTWNWHVIGGHDVEGTSRRRWVRGTAQDAWYEMSGSVGVGMLSGISSSTTGPEIDAMWLQSQRVVTPPSGIPVVTEYGGVYRTDTDRPSFVLAEEGPNYSDMTVELRLRVEVPGIRLAELERPVQGQLQAIPTRPVFTGTPTVGTPLQDGDNKWNGKRETGRANRFAVIHTSEGGLTGVTGDRDRLIAYLRTVEGRYAGYHYVVDAGGVTRYLDPSTHRAYHSYGGNDGVGICIATDAAKFGDLSPAGQTAIINNIIATLGAHSIPRTRIDVSTGTPVAATTTTPGYILLPSTASGVTGHGDIQDDRTDPGPGFPWDDLLL